MRNLSNILWTTIMFASSLIHAQTASDKKNIYSQTIEETTFKDGKKNGPVKEYYTTGELKSEIPFINGQMNGVAKYYFKNGKVRREIPYVNGKVSGPVKAYNEQGIPITRK